VDLPGLAWLFDEENSFSPVRRAYAVDDGETSGGDMLWPGGGEVYGLAWYRVPH